LFRYWKEQYVEVNLRTKRLELYKSTLINHLSGAFTGRAIGDITVKQSGDLFGWKERESPCCARQLLFQARTAFAWCIRRQVTDSASIMRIAPRDLGVGTETSNRVLTHLANTAGNPTFAIGMGAYEF
jgi:hypothetical protein